MKTLSTTWKIIFILLLCITFCMIILLTLNVHNLYQTGSLRPSRNFNHTDISKGTARPDQIQKWMTFSYINYIFNLPPTYLSQTLHIQDTRYPNISIVQYAKTNNIDPLDFVTIIQHSIIQYDTLSVPN